MSLQSEIDRLNTAKSDIVSAIEEKSVEIPESARLSDVSEYIRAIPQSFGTEMFVVTLTVDAENVYTSDKSASSIVEAHNSGKIVIAIEQGSSSTIIKYNLTGYAPRGAVAYFDGYIDDNTVAHITITDIRGQTKVDYYETILAEADTLSDYVKTVNGNAPDESGNVTVIIPTVPTKVSELTNDSGFLTLQDISNKADKPSQVTSGENITLADNAEYRLTNVSNLTIEYPDTNFECWLRIATVAEGTVTITLPTSSYIGDTPTFANGETWELSIKDGIVIANKVTV